MKVTLLAVLVRLFLDSTPLAEQITHWVEVASPITSHHRIREATFLVGVGRSPYEGWAYHGPPLLLPLLQYTSHNHILRVLPFLFSDLVAAWALRRLQNRFSISVHLGNVYLLNPFSILTCVGCSLGSIENCFVSLAIYGALSKKPFLAALSISCAAYIGFHPLLLAIPVALMLVEQKSGQWRIGLQFLCWLSLTFLTLCATSALYLSQFAEHAAHSWLPSLLDSVEWDEMRQGSSSLNSSVHHWMIESYGFQLKAEDLTPNMGLWWYFFTEMFPFYRPFFLFVFHSASVLFLLPLCVAYSDAPLFALVLQCITHAVFKPYPTLSDYSLVPELLLLFPEVLKRVEWWWFMTITGALLCVLEPAMWHEWVQTESANANFYFSINLLTATWWIVLMALLIHAKNQPIHKLKHD